jgi:hypothetical protein
MTIELWNRYSSNEMDWAKARILCIGYEHRTDRYRPKMSAKTPLTEYANLAMDELFQLTFVCRQIAGDIGYDESVLQARNRKWPDISPVTNVAFNSAAFRFLGVLQLCRAVDIYNWYCREALKLALSANPKPVIDIVRRRKGRIAETIARADRKRRDAAAGVISEFLKDKYRGDRVIRETVHRDLDVMQNPEIELLCTCRNVVVHKRGHDEFGEIAKGIRDLGSRRALIGALWYPTDHMPIALDKENNLIINEGVGNWAAELMQQQIFMMDQNFARVYRLPRKTWERTKIGRTFLGPPKIQRTASNRTGQP